MRTRAECEAEMLGVVEHARTADDADDDVAYDLDHTHLSDLLTEWQTIPLQRPQSP